MATQAIGATYLRGASRLLREHDQANADEAEHYALALSIAMSDASEAGAMR